TGRSTLMRSLTNILVTLCEFIILVLLVIFAVENIRAERYTFIGNTFAGNVWWTVAGSALLGFIFAALALGPGRVAVGLRSRKLSREHGRTGQELAALRGEHEQLQAEHARVLSERDQLQSALATTNTATVESAPSQRTYSANPADEPGVGTVSDGTNAQYTAPQTSPGANYDASQQGTREGGLRGTLRRLRAGDETRTPNSPPAPTA
ncbi:MAG: hypothetical protein ACRDHP_10420, partial [Ktedonobacterales bacterium]